MSGQEKQRHTDYTQGGAVVLRCFVEERGREDDLLPWRRWRKQDVRISDTILNQGG